jgi:hypothetical protein
MTGEVIAEAPDFSFMSCSRTLYDNSQPLGMRTSKCLRPVKEIYEGKPYCGRHLSGEKQRKAALRKGQEAMRVSTRTAHELRTLANLLGLPDVELVGHNLTGGWREYTGFTVDAEELRARMEAVYDEGFVNAEEEHDGMAGVSHWENRNPYRKAE